MAWAWRWPRRRNAARTPAPLAGRARRGSARRGASTVCRGPVKNSRDRDLAPRRDRHQLHHRVGGVERRARCPRPARRWPGCRRACRGCGSAGRRPRRRPRAARARSAPRAASRIISVWVVAAPIHRWSPRSSMPVQLRDRGEVEERRRGRALPSFASHQDVGAAGHAAAPRRRAGPGSRAPPRASAAGSSAGAAGAGGVGAAARRARGAGRVRHRVEDLRVAGAAAEVAGEAVRGSSSAPARGLAVEQGLGGQHHARDADAALHAALLDEGVLQRVQPPSSSARPSIVSTARAVGLVGQHQARVDRAGRPRAPCRRRTRPCRSLPWRR